ncbi:hypothetical protein TCAL_11047, partial [Tigriopus californicus]
QQSSFADVNISALLNSFQEGYDKRVRPNYGGEPVTVGVTMYVLSISSVSEVMMDFTLDMYFRQFWRDPRLSFERRGGLEKLVVGAEYINMIWVPDTFFVNEKTAYFHDATTDNQFLRILHTGEILRSIRYDFTLDMYFRQFWQDPRLSFEGQKGLKKLVVGAQYIEKIWVPDTFFVNEKTAYFHKATTENQFLRILNTGEILRSIRLTITASCPMDLQYFPMDRQLCYIEIESFGYTMSDIRYKWNDGLNSVQISADVSLPQFKVLGHRQKTIEASLSTGNYSRLACEIQFVRSMGYYLIQIYIPSSLIVIISWVSFWLNRGATPARVGLGVTTVLTMTTLMASTNAALPKISYVKSIDVYLGACFFMVFASLLGNNDMPPNGNALANATHQQLECKKNLQKMMGISPSDIDKYSRIFFPISFISFNLMYWIIYLHVSDEIAEDLTVHFKVHDPKMHCKGGSRENTISRYHHENKYSMHHRGLPPGMRHFDEEAPPPLPPPPQQQQHYGRPGPPGPPGHPGPPPPPVPPLVPPNPDCDMKELNKMFGMTASDIDKYSRIMFPVTFTCFQLMYWIIYQHLSDNVVEDLVYLHGE